MRVFLGYSILLGSICGIGFVFWHQELQYALPTPVPNHYKPVPVGSTVALSDFFSSKNSGYYFHFYNPDCPCSLFNAAHVRQLIDKYNGQMEVVIVVPQQTDVASARDEFGTDVQILPDIKGRLAAALGVYSTPQAAILAPNQQLYFRGNYNRSRYCTSMATNYAELALVAFFNNRPPPAFDVFATQSYGCTLPQNKSFTSLNF